MQLLCFRHFLCIFIFTWTVSVFMTSPSEVLRCCTLLSNVAALSETFSLKCLVTECDPGLFKQLIRAYKFTSHRLTL